MKKFFAWIMAVFIILSAQVTFAATRTVYLNFQAYVQDFGWQKAVGNGKVAGTVGQGKRIEALLINFMDGTTSMIQYNAHVQNIGWQGWKESGAVAGTAGKNLRLEAVRIRLVGEYAKVLDIYAVGWVGRLTVNLRELQARHFVWRLSKFKSYRKAQKLIAAVKLILRKLLQIFLRFKKFF